MNLFNKVDSSQLKSELENSEIVRRTLSFYKYYPIHNPQFFRDHLFILLSQIHVLGRIYVAKEGINGQISVPENNLKQLRTSLNQITFLNNCRLNIAREDNGKSFYKLVIKVKTKIVADGIKEEDFNISENGQHIDSREFNELTSGNDTVIIDMRNHYESEVGHFQKAICPDVETFRESLPIVENIMKENKDKNIVMYCTGGIRCEKATAYFKSKGFDNLYQLDGGIIEYARQVEERGLENKFVGKNFVFDDRLGERITEDVIAKCHQCGKPCDTHKNCENEACHILFIQCAECEVKYHKCCSDKCKDFMKLTTEEKEGLKGKITFNGSKFGKGRYRAHKSSDVISSD